MDTMGYPGVWPTTGRCGHTICSGCHQKAMYEGKNEGVWQPCPALGCDCAEAFEMLNQKSEVLVHCVTMAERREKELTTLIDKAGEHVAMKASLHIDRLKKKHEATVASHKRKEEETRFTLASKDDEIQQLRWKIQGMLDYQSSMHKQMESLLTQVREIKAVSSLPETDNERLFAQQSLSENEGWEARGRVNPRRVSHHPRETLEEDEDSCSTQENEFI